MIKNITIYYPDGKNSSFGIGAFLIGENKKPSKIKVIKITTKKRECIITLSDKTKLNYNGLPFSFSI